MKNTIFRDIATQYDFIKPDRKIPDEFSRQVMEITRPETCKEKLSAG